MLVLAKVVMAIMLGFVFSVVFGYFALKWLKHQNLGQNVSKTLGERHEKKQGTPTMGGIMFIIPTLVIMFVLILMDKVDVTANLFVVLFVFVAYALLGYVDDYIIVKKHNNKGLSIIFKLFVQLVIALVFFYIYLSSGNDPVVDIHTLGIKINLGWLYGLFLLFVLVGSSNSVNITDGLDGLAAGLSAIAFFAFGINIVSISISLITSEVELVFMSAGRFFFFCELTVHDLCLFFCWITCHFLIFHTLF